MSRLHDTEFAEILTHSIAGDVTVKTVSEAIDPLLRSLSLKAPDLLLWARLLNSAGRDIGNTMLPPMLRLAEANGGLKSLSTTALELLAWQLHVDFRELASNDLTLAKMVLASVPWHRKKGTPASVKEALALFGYDVTIEENGPGQMWATYQLELQSAARRAVLEHMVEIATEMQPARCKLWRMFNSEYDWRPGIWSGGGCRQEPGVPGDDHLWRHCWSYFWWSFWSGTPVPGIPGLDDDHDLIVSFGQRDGFQSEQYLTDALHAAWGMTQYHGFRIPYVDHAFWSWSNWSDVYPLNSSFIVSELISLLCGDYIYSGPEWDGEWDERIWGTRKIDIRRAPWTMGHYPWSKSHLVFSERWEDNGNRGGKYGDINSCYSLPIWYYIDGDTPEWSQYLWSDIETRVKSLTIREQFQETHSAVGEKDEELCVNAASAREESAAYLGVYPDFPIWSRFAYSDSFPVRHGFARADLLSTQTGEEILEQLPWDDEWDERAWGRRISIDRPQPEWTMATQAWSKSQLVYSEPHEDGSRYGDINSCYSRPAVIEYPAPPAYSNFSWSDSVSEIEIKPIDYQEISGFSSTAEPYDGLAEIPTGFAQLNGKAIQSEDLWQIGWGLGWDSRRWLWPCAYTNIFGQSSSWDLHYILHVLAPGATVVPVELPVSNYPTLHCVLTGLMEGVTLCHVFDRSNLKDVVTLAEELDND